MGKKAALALIVLYIASLVLLCTPAVKAQSIPYYTELPPRLHILADGSIDPSNASVSRAGDVYTLTGDVGNNIAVDRDNVTIDGAGHTLWGNFSGRVNLDKRLGVTVKNLILKEAGGFAMYQAADNTFFGNTFINCSVGFSFFVTWRNNITQNTFLNVGKVFDIVGYSTGTSQHNIIVGNVFQNCGKVVDLSQPNNVFSDNTITDSYDLGVSISADYTTFHNNTLNNNLINFEISSFDNNDVDESNTINGKPLIYWTGRHDETVPSNAAYVVLVECSNIQARNLNVEGISLASTIRSSVIDNKISSKPTGLPYYPSSYFPYEDTRDSTDIGIQLVNCQNNTISNNIISGKAYGLKLTDCTAINVASNHVTGNRYCGILLTNCEDNRIISNIFGSNTYFGMKLSNSNNNTIEGNTIASNGFVTGSYSQGDAFGVSIADSSNNRFVGNLVTGNNAWGIRVLGTQHDNVFYHNNFVSNQVRDNSLQVSMLGSDAGSPANHSIWDNGAEGNYWSDYLARYPNASEVDGSGVADTPFFINVNNQDNYPLMTAYDISIYTQPSPSSSPTGSSSISPSETPTSSGTPQTSQSPTVTSSTSPLPLTSSEPNTPPFTPWTLLLIGAMVAVVVAIVLILVFGLHHHK